MLALSLQVTRQKPKTVKRKSCAQSLKGNKNGPGLMCDARDDRAAPRSWRSLGVCPNENENMLKLWGSCPSGSTSVLLTFCYRR